MRFIGMIAAGALAVSAMAVNTAAAQQQIRLRMSTESLGTTAAGVILKSFGEALKAELGARVTTEYFDGGALGDEAVHLDAVRTGQIHVYPLGSDAVQLAPLWAIFDMPFLFSDRATVTKIVDGPIGAEMAASMKQRARLEVLGFGEAGFRMMTNSVRPIVKPQDLAGLRIRVPGSKTRILMFQMLGANPISIGMGEIYLALQSKTVDGQENPLSSVVSWSLHEVQPFTTLSRHVYSPSTLVMHGPTFDAMDEATKAAVKRAAKVAVQATRDYAEKNDQGYIEKITTKSKVNEIDLPAFQAASKPIWEEIGKIAGKEFTDKVIAAATAK